MVLTFTSLSCRHLLVVGISPILTHSYQTQPLFSSKESLTLIVMWEPGNLFFAGINRTWIYQQSIIFIRVRKKFGILSSLIIITFFKRKPNKLSLKIISIVNIFSDTKQPLSTLIDWNKNILISKLLKPTKDQMSSLLSSADHIIVVSIQGKTLHRL